MMAPWQQTPTAGPNCPMPRGRTPRATLHLWTQVVGKIRLARTPWLNHSWHVALYVTARGLTTGPIPDGAAHCRSISILSTTCCGCARATAMSARSARGRWRWRSSMPSVMIALEQLGIAVAIRTMPCEIPDCIAVRPGHRACLLRCRRCATGSGACCWRASRAGAFPHGVPRQGEPGAFLLGLVRSGGDAVLGAACATPSRRRAASARRGGARGLFARGVERRLLAGRPGPIDYPAFYSYAYPAPDGFAAAKVKPAAAFF